MIFTRICSQKVLTSLRSRKIICYKKCSFCNFQSLVSALNPLKKEATESQPKLSASQTVSFSTPTSSYDPATLNNEDYEIRHFAIVDITPGGKPLFICDAKHSDRSKWFVKKSAQSFDVALRRRRSMSCARMNRRAFSLNKMAELDASAKRAAYSRQRVNRRPESSFIGDPFNFLHIYKFCFRYQKLQPSSNVLCVR
jgi:hypothetical protein